MSKSHRRYPGPFPPVPGMCRWCALWIKDAAGKIDYDAPFCGPVCKTHYQLRADPQKMRQHVFFRDGGKCACCPTVFQYLDDEWEADHIIPLMIALWDPKAWEPDNVRLLCMPCHKKKSADDRRKYRKKFRRRAHHIYDEIGD